MKYGLGDKHEISNIFEDKLSRASNKNSIKRLTKINKFLDAHTALYYSSTVKYIAVACYKIADKHG